MAYNNGFPVNYPQYYPQYQQVPQFNQNDNSFIWVQGEAAAKAYHVGPNVKLPLWDSEKQVIYIKSADANGVPKIDILDYTIRGAKSLQNTDEKNEYALKSEIESLKAEIAALQKQQPEVSETVRDDYVSKSDLDDIRNELAAIQKRLDRRPRRHESSVRYDTR